MLPFRSRRVRSRAGGVLVSLLFLGGALYAAEQSPSPTGTPKKRPSPASLTNIPLPVGQQAKGLVLPDFDMEGHMRARFEAGTARRIDTEHMEFTALKMITYTPQNTTDMLIEMPTSTMDLTSRVIQSHARTTVKRSDFTISGDTMRFDTIARQGTLVGNVKMILTGQQPTRKKEP
ncbi:MAG: hypothetical protein M3Y86_04555 [Verrucomicrobiota bacterium]|nr:hypothetical protein [Verrucomicrobiota bacterium]